MKIAVIRFPGTNNEHESARALTAMGVDCQIVDHYNEDMIPDYDGYWLAGGFSYSDVLRAGALAASSRLMELLIQEQKPILGVCNGFQILTEAHLLPGALLPNTSTRFICKWVHVKVTTTNGFLSELDGQVLKLPIAHFEGNLYHPSEEEVEDFAVLRYCDHDGNIVEEANPNGSMNNIAGLSTAAILGLMPHPERAFFKYQGSTDGKKIIEAFVQEVKR